MLCENIIGSFVNKLKVLNIDNGKRLDIKGVLFSDNVDDLGSDVNLLFCYWLSSCESCGEELEENEIKG